MFLCCKGFPVEVDEELVVAGTPDKALTVARDVCDYDAPPPNLDAHWDNSVVLCDRGCGKPVPPGEYRPGKKYKTCCRSCALNPGLGCHDPTCGGQKAAGPARPACKFGARCKKKKDQAHLASEAHPLDEDYASACASSKMDAEPLSIKLVFDWADTDGSGRLGRDELLAAYAVLKRICKDHIPDLSDEAWHSLDEDGNGVLNFMEFASWAGPRLGLPLGMKAMRQRTNTDVLHAPCSVLGCPCEHMEEGPRSVCKACHHKADLHRAKNQDHAEVPFPEYWDHHDGDFNELVDLNASAVAEFQEVLNRTYLNKWTRDRSRHNPARPQVPKGFKVIAARRNENAHSWIEYGCRRAEVLHRLEEEWKGKVVTYQDVKSMLAYKEIAGAKADRLAHEVNEWYLFHGTSPENAKKIMKDDFRVSLAGSNTGTLYGRGLYFAESITKADEYAKADGDQVYAVLLCRVIGGIVNYCDQVEPDPEKLVQSCISGSYNCVLGDREKCRGTFREFVLFDSEDVYAEYVILYKREY